MRYISLILPFLLCSCATHITVLTQEPLLATNNTKALIKKSIGLRSVRLETIPYFYSEQEAWQTALATNAGIYGLFIAAIPFEKSQEEIKLRSYLTTQAKLTEIVAQKLISDLKQSGSFNLQEPGQSELLLDVSISKLVLLREPGFKFETYPWIVLSLYLEDTKIQQSYSDIFFQGKSTKTKMTVEEWSRKPEALKQAIASAIDQAIISGRPVLSDYLKYRDEKEDDF